MMATAANNKRRDKDVMKLLVSEYEVNLVNDNSTSEFIVKFFGPKDSAYEGVSKFCPYFLLTQHCSEIVVRTLLFNLIGFKCTYSSL